LSLASAVTRTLSCSQRVPWSWSQTTNRCGEKARPNVYPSQFIVVSVHRHACQLIKLCSENATFYRRQSVVYRQWHPVRTAGHIAAGSMIPVGAEYADPVLRNRAFDHRRRHFRPTAKLYHSTAAVPSAVSAMYTSSAMHSL